MTPTAQITLLQNVVDHLAMRGISATVEYPGCVVIPNGETWGWWFGTANENWDGDLTDGYGEVFETRGTGLSGDTEDAGLIADRIASTIAEPLERPCNCTACLWGDGH